MISFTSITEASLLVGYLINLSSKDSHKISYLYVKVQKKGVQAEWKVLSETHLIQHGLDNKS